MQELLEYLHLSMLDLPFEKIMKMLRDVWLWIVAAARDELDAGFKREAEAAKKAQINTRNDFHESQAYGIGVTITAIIVFIGSWIYCIATYGYLFGVGLGWLPSLIVAAIAGALWPLLVIAVVVVGFLILKH